MCCTILAESIIVQEMEKMWLHWTDSTAIFITVWGIYVFTQMVHSENWKNIAPMETLITIQMDGSFVWISFLLGAFHQVKKSTDIMKMKGSGKKEKEKKWMHCLFNMNYFHLLDLGSSLNLCSSILHHIAIFQEADGTSSSLPVR